MTLPRKHVLFLGGHQNMVNKLKQVYPKWTYVSAERVRRHSIGPNTLLIHWTNHSSHKSEEAVRARMNASDVIYVTATNIPALLEQIEAEYKRMEAVK